VARGVGAPLPSPLSSREAALFLEQRGGDVARGVGAPLRPPRSARVAVLFWEQLRVTCEATVLFLEEGEAGVVRGAGRTAVSAALCPRRGGRSWRAVVSLRPSPFEGVAVEVGAPLSVSAPPRSKAWRSKLARR
jgi:hypothetical protein